MRNAIKSLRSGEILILDGVSFQIALNNEGQEKGIQPGDAYIAERNLGPELLIAKVVDHEKGWIIPQSAAYVYNIWECVPVELVE